MGTAYSNQNKRFPGKREETQSPKLESVQRNQSKITGKQKLAIWTTSPTVWPCNSFLNEGEGKIHIYGEFIRCTHDKYASAATDNWIASHLRKFPISQFDEMEETSSEAYALRRTVHEIDHITAMYHSEDKSDRTKFLLLRAAWDRM